jgi:hypothetical protein
MARLMDGGHAQAHRWSNLEKSVTPVDHFLTEGVDRAAFHNEIRVRRNYGVGSRKSMSKMG